MRCLQSGVEFGCTVQEDSRDELFGGKKGPPPLKGQDVVDRLGARLQTDDAREVRQETEKQEYMLDEIMKGVDNLKTLATVSLLP